MTKFKNVMLSRTDIDTAPKDVCILDCSNDGSTYKDANGVFQNIQCNVNGEVIYDESVKVKDQRISTLEALLREVVKQDERTNDILCFSCGTGDCKKSCLIARIQKELGE